MAKLEFCIESSQYVDSNFVVYTKLKAAKQRLQLQYDWATVQRLKRNDLKYYWCC